MNQYHTDDENPDPVRDFGPWPLIVMGVVCFLIGIYLMTRG